MAQQIADRRDVDFVLHEMLQVEQLSKHDRLSSSASMKSLQNLIKRRWI